MKHILQKLLFLCIVANAGTLVASNPNCTTNSCNTCKAPNKPITCFTPRSQSFNNIIKDAGLDPDNEFLFDVAGFNGTLKINFEYDHSFNSNNLGKCLFGQAAVCMTGCNDDAISINIVGTEATPIPNNTTNLVADAFFLPKDFSSSVSIKPSIQNYNVHLEAYFGFDGWCTGLYARLYAPITVSVWKLEARETIASPGTVGYAAGEIAPVAVNVTPTNQVYSSFLSYTRGDPIPNNGQLPGSTSPVVAGPTVQQLRYTRFGGCEHDTTTQLADLRAEFGWNFLFDKDYHLGIYIAAAAPTANDCENDCNTLLWGAKAGNGKHWELGGGISGHCTMWRSDDCTQRFDFFVDATINHMFAHTELRTFDLIDNPLSRYIFAQQLTTATTGLTIGGTQAAYQFGAAYAPVANFTTQPVSISFPVQADVLAKFVYTCAGFSWAIGYDFWVQACPSIEQACSDACNATVFPVNTWAFRGDAHVYGFNATTSAPVAIPATYSNQTTFVIGTAYEGPSSTDNNASVDNPGLAAIGGTALNNIPSGGIQLNGSNPPIFIAQSDIDYCNVTRGLSNSLFTEFNYTWIDRECWIPYVGVGARIEFGNNGSGNCHNTVNTIPTTTTTTTTCNTNCNNSCSNNSCGTCSVTKWGIWIQGGLSFN